MAQIESFDILHRCVYAKIISFNHFFTFSRARTHVYTHQNSNTTHYGNHNTPAKKIFLKFFLSRNFKFLNFGFSRNFLSSEMDCLHQTLVAGFNPAGVQYVLSVFQCSYMSAYIPQNRQDACKEFLRNVYVIIHLEKCTFLLSWR